MWETVHVRVLAVLGVLAGSVLSQADQHREVNISQGTVRGHRSDNFNVYEFYNIPYATAPQGTSRFKAPGPPPNFTETFDAVYRGIQCPQPDWGDIEWSTYATDVTENCLVANIYAPVTEQNNLPVLVIVHGGAYQLGFGSIYTANGFVESHQVIVVTFNYRVSVHGFLCLGTEDAPGNAGMKDQVELLRWVKNNIANFGGNPDDVTITGCSAGGSSVDTLLLSKLTDGLFNKVIADSGCSNAPFGAQLDPLQNAKDHVIRLNFTNVDVENITALDEFYKTTSLEILNSFTFLETKDSYFVFQPCVEKDVGQEIFLDDAPVNILRSGNYKKVPIMYGYANMEGLFRLDVFDEWKDKMNDNFADFLPADLVFENEQDKQDLAQEVKEFYFENKPINETTILSYLDYFSDVIFITPIHRAVTFQVGANNTDIYLYDYSFVHNGSIVIPHADVQGANHCEQFDTIRDVLNITSPEFLEKSRAMRQMFFNFMTTGNPTPQDNHSSLVTWLPSGANRSPHLSVGETIELLEVPPIESRAAFWDTIYENRYRTPIPPNPNINPQYREVNINQGTVRGHRSDDFNVFEFYNIPYATAPEGTSKFNAPGPPPNFSETFDAVYRGIQCPQPDWVIPTFATDSAENCLVANIYTPDTEQNNLPVLVIVHGGAYQVGFGTIYKANGFVESHQIIVVTFNYRLAVHGFLCLGTEDAPGNAAMKDQVALLRWVRNNIANFGGNPDDVTITGCSAGGSSVDTLLLSKLTDGLFNRVIADSGCSNAPFGAQLDPIQNAKDHVIRLNFTDVDVENITALEEFYKTTPLEILLTYNFLDSKDTYFFFQPCVEKDVGQEIFLDDAPVNILRSGSYRKVPIMYGYAHMEGMFRLDVFDEWKDKMNDNFADFLPADLEFEDDQDKEDLAQEVKEFYFGNETVNENTILSYVDYFSDVMFITPVHRAVTFQVGANNTDIYLYDYSFVHNGSLVIPHADVQGATHCEQFDTIRDVPFTSPEFLEKSRTMRQMFFNFMTTGNPTPQEDTSIQVTWWPSGANRSPHLSVGSTIELLEVPPIQSRANFWDTIYEKRYRTPIAPNHNAAALHLMTTPFWIMYTLGILKILHF